MLDENVQWVRNIRAAGGRAFILGGSRKTIQCKEVAVDQLAPILKAYLQHVPGARPHVTVDGRARCRLRADRVGLSDLSCSLSRDKVNVERPGCVASARYGRRSLQSKRRPHTGGLLMSAGPFVVD
jgi:hypothetical protein